MVTTKGEHTHTIAATMSRISALNAVVERARERERLQTGITPKQAVTDALDRLTALELCCVLGAVRGHLGTGLTLVELYDQAVAAFVEHYMHTLQP